MQSGKVMRKPRGVGLEKKGQGTRGKTIWRQTWRKTKGWWTLTKRLRYFIQLFWRLGLAGGFCVCSVHLVPRSSRGWNQIPFIY